MRTVAMVVVKMLALAALLMVSSCGRQEDRARWTTPRRHTTPIALRYLSNRRTGTNLPNPSRKRGRLKLRWAVPAQADAVRGNALQEQALQEQAVQEHAVQERPAPAELRFDMTKNGKAQTAEQFDAWMREQGVRVVESADAQSADVRSTN